jgi:hypothetical protein
VAKYPTLIVCGFVMMASIQSLFSGLILSNMERNNRREFETTRNQLNHTCRMQLEAEKNKKTD